MSQYVIYYEYIYGLDSKREKQNKYVDSDRISSINWNNCFLSPLLKEFRKIRRNGYYIKKIINYFFFLLKIGECGMKLP
jgi:hypothetical protein